MFLSIVNYKLTMMLHHMLKVQENTFKNTSSACNHRLQCYHCQEPPLVRNNFSPLNNYTRSWTNIFKVIALTDPQFNKSDPKEPTVRRCSTATHLS